MPILDFHTCYSYTRSLMTRLKRLAEAPATIYAVSRGLLSDWLLGTDRGLWRLLDTGELAQQALRLKDVHISAVAHTERGVFVGAADGIARSLDGENWTAGETPEPIHVSHIAQTTSTKQHGILFAVTLDHGLFRTMDAGLSWAPCNNGLQSREALAVAPSTGFHLQYVVYAAFADGVYHGTGAGSVWHRLPVPAETLPPTGLLATTEGLLLSAEAGLWTSSDSGATWIARPDAGRDIIALTCSPDTQWSALLTPERIARSHDSGVTWEDLGQAPEGAHTIAISENGVVLCATLESGAWLSE